MSEMDLNPQAKAGLQKALNRRIREGGKRYNRMVHLPRLAPGMGLENLPREDIIAKLQNALRAAKNAVRKGHWSGDGNRIIALRQALRGELYYYGRDK